MTEWLPPRYREPLPPPRITLLDPSRPALRWLVITLLAVLFSLLAWGVAFALLV